MDDMDDWCEEMEAFERYQEIRGEHEGDIERDNTPVVRGITEHKEKKEGK